MVGMNFAVFLLAIGLFGAALFVLVGHLYRFYQLIKHRQPQPWLDRHPDKRQPPYSKQENSK